MNHQPDIETNSVGKPPKIVHWLAYGGLTPFVLLTVASWLDPEHSDLWLQALVSYGAVILSFVGALHWGFAMNCPGMSAQQKQYSFIWSVMPSLLAWLALLIQPDWAAWLLVFGLLVHLWQDWRLAKQLEVPNWYLPMRLRLTVTSCLCLALSSIWHII